MNKKNRHISKILDIGGVFLRDYKGSFSGREIARLAGISPQTAINVLNRLLHANVVFYKQEGRNNKYGLNIADLRARIFLQTIESEKSRFFLENMELREIITSVLPFAEAVVVFGSFAQGREKEDSDLDLVVIQGNEEKVQQVRKIFPREINMEFVNWKQFSAAFKNKKSLAVEIQRNHIFYGNVVKVVEVYCS